MSRQWVELSGRRRTIARRVYARDRADPDYRCPQCGRPIDWTLPYKDPYTGQVNLDSKTVDHVVEIQDGGHLTDLDNLTTAHLGCNSGKGAARAAERAAERRAIGSENVIAVDPMMI